MKWGIFVQRLTYRVSVMVFNTTFNNISVIWCRSALMVEEINFREYRRDNQKGQYRETGNIRYTRRRKTKQKHNTICVAHHYMQTNTNNLIRHEPSYTQMEVKTNRTSFLYGNRSTRKKPQICRKLFYKRNHIILYHVHLVMSRIWTHSFSCARYWLHR